MDTLTIVGGGAAGIMAALHSRMDHPKRRTILLDHQPSLGQKLLASGAGRCNITNANVTAKRFSGAPQSFVGTVLKQYDHKDVRAFFEELGIPLYEERKTGKGKIFPVTDQARTVLMMLLDELSRRGVEVRTGCRVTRVEKTAGGFALHTSQGRMDCRHLILASGGRTRSDMGGHDSGYELARRLGHRLVEPVPTALPLLVKNPVCKRLHGLQTDVEAAALVAGREVCRDSGKVMFTKYGFTGPAILGISRPISVRMNREGKSDCELRLNFLPGLSAAQAKAQLERRWSKRPDQLMSLSLCGLLKNRIPQAFLAYLRIDDAPVAKVPTADKNRILKLLLGWRLPIEGTKGWEEGEFTAGGVDCRDIDPSCMGSRIVPGLYFAGEILDVDGDVGGFNLTWAWASGAVAGRLKTPGGAQRPRRP